jgi:cell division septal protein FtsQ
MASSRYKQRRRQWAGVLPRIGQGLLAAAGWVVRHPQPTIIGVLVALTIWALIGYAQRADAFRIVNVLLPTDTTLHLPEPLVGRSLWSVNLQDLSERLARQQPSLKHVRLVRRLPNVLQVIAIPRRPIAQIRMDRWHAVDRDRFVFPEGSDEPAERLTRLSGLDRMAVRFGKTNDDERLALALRVLERLRRAPPSIARRVTEIHVGDPQQLRFFLDGELEIRCGTEAQLDVHLARLQGVLRRLAAPQAPIVRYVDVRFEQPVVGPQS